MFLKIYNINLLKKKIIEDVLDIKMIIDININTYRLYFNKDRMTKKRLN